jgi:hypothetical protein
MDKDMMACCCMAKDEDFEADEVNCEKKEGCKKCCCCCRIMKALCLIGVGFLIGVHYRAIKAALKGEPLPKAPAWHCWIKKKDQ